MRNHNAFALLIVALIIVSGQIFLSSEGRQLSEVGKKKTSMKIMLSLPIAHRISGHGEVLKKDNVGRQKLLMETKTEDITVNYRRTSPGHSPGIGH